MNSDLNKDGWPCVLKREFDWLLEVSGKHDWPRRAIEWALDGGRLPESRLAAAHLIYDGLGLPTPEELPNLALAFERASYASASDRRSITRMVEVLLNRDELDRLRARYHQNIDDY